MVKMQDITGVVTVCEFSKRTGINEHTVRRMCRNGELPARYLARRWLIDFNKFLESLDAQPTHRAG